MKKVKVKITNIDLESGLEDIHRLVNEWLGEEITIQVDDELVETMKKIDSDDWTGCDFDHLIQINQEIEDQEVMSYDLCRDLEWKLSGLSYEYEVLSVEEVE